MTIGNVSISKVSFKFPACATATRNDFPAGFFHATSHFNKSYLDTSPYPLTDTIPGLHSFHIDAFSEETVMGFFLFVIIPLVELYLLTRISGIVGLPGTIALVVVTGILGSRLARSQGIHVWAKIQEQLKNGKLPAAEMVDALMVLVAGVLLVTPGALTDFVGLSFLLPPIRSLARPALIRWLKGKLKVGVSGASGFGYTQPGRTRGPGFGGQQESRPERAPKEEQFDPFAAKKRGPVHDADVVVDGGPDRDDSLS